MIGHRKLEGERVDGDGVLSGVHLQDTSQETLREEEPGEPEARGLPFSEPRAHECYSAEVVLEPGP